MFSRGTLVYTPILDFDLVKTTGVNVLGIGSTLAFLKVIVFLLYICAAAG